MKSIFWILGAGALGLALAVIFVRHPRFKLALILWFSAVGVIYRLGLQSQGGDNLRGYLGGVAHTFNLTTSFTNSLLNLLFLSLFLGSASLLLWSFLARAEEVQLKAVCAHCGGHIAFSARNLGQRLPCPHCQKTISLRKPGLLKMSCFFCHGHIEFPAQAIGGKVACPHCKMDITLKEPA
jgi:hypothetical protein